MKSEGKILVAFLCNVFFTLFELIGGALTNSVSIASDAIHDLGDAVAIGISYFLERYSRKHADKSYTYGYARFSILGSAITTAILVTGSIVVISEAFGRILHPEAIDYRGMLWISVAGVVLNLIATFTTNGGISINQRTVNLHMFEDLMGWTFTLFGAILMNVFDISIIDPLFSIAVAVFILYHAVRNFSEVLDVFLERVPRDLDIDELRKQLASVSGVHNIHHLHVWCIADDKVCATFHISAANKSDHAEIKSETKKICREFGINHSTVEIEEKTESCAEGDDCDVFSEMSTHHLHSHEHGHNHAHRHAHRKRKDS